MKRSTLVLLLGFTAGVGCEVEHRERFSTPEGAARAEAEARAAMGLPCASDGVLRGSVVISDQGELNRREGCELVTGNLSLGMFPGIDETPLLSLRDVEGGLWIYGQGHGPIPGALAGFRALEEARELMLNGLTLTSLEPLGRLRRIGVATSGPDFDAVEAERTMHAGSPPNVGPGLSILSCKELSSFEGLSALEEVERIELSGNEDLVSLAGLSGLRDLPELSVLGSPLIDPTRQTSEPGWPRRAPAGPDPGALTKLRPHEPEWPVELAERG